MEEEIKVENDFALIRFQNDGPEPFFTHRQLTTDFIQFHFVLKGNAKFSFNNGNYDLALQEEKILSFIQSTKGATISFRAFTKFVDDFCYYFN